MDNNKKQNVALSSVWASLLLTALKLAVGIVTGSIGIISEAAHSGLDFGAATLTYFAVRISDKPADREHHYGHTKVESVSALIATGLLLLTSGWVIYESIHRLLVKTTEVKVAWYSIAVLVISIVVDFSRSRALKRIAKETNSQALEADALHFSSDILSSFVVLIGLVFVYMGMSWADAVAGIVVAVLIGYAAFSLGKKTVDVLVDAAPEGLTDRIAEITRDVDGVITIEKLKVKPAGPFVFVEMTVSVSRTLSLEKVNVICSSIEERIRSLIPLADMTINTKPIALDCETIAERVHVIGLNHNLHVHNVATTIEEDKRHISFDVEVEHNLTIKQAHDVVSSLELEIRKEFDGDVDISVHIDPLRSEEKRGYPLAHEVETAIQKTIIQKAQEIDGIHEVHDIQVRKTESDKLFISLHCTFDDGVLLDEVHTITNRFEWLIQQHVPDAHRVVIHAEPLLARD